MNETAPVRRIMAVLAHPDDETLGTGGALAHYARQGADVSVVTATRGQAGRYRGLRPGAPGHPGPAALADIREAELRAAGAVLGVRDVINLGFDDSQLDRVDPHSAIAVIVEQLRRLRPEVVITFAPDGAYGHPDHIAISQFTAAAIVAAADPAFARDGVVAAGRPHAVSKFYFIAWPTAVWDAYQAAVQRLVSLVDGVERQVTPWPEWAITTTIDTSHVSAIVSQAVACHESQVAGYAALMALPPEHQRALWESQSFYRVFSLVNGGRAKETDLFEGLT